MFCPFSIQINWSFASCMLMLIGAIDALSGDLHTYFLMRELSGRTLKFIIWCACLWINTFSQIVSSFFLLTGLNRLAELLISCPVFQKCDAMADLSVWFNLRFLKWLHFLWSELLTVFFELPIFALLSHSQVEF